MEARKVTVDSDKWSFGVTIWEIFSLGEHPYPDRNVHSSLVADLNKGYRMGQPDQCPSKIYNELILPCWDKVPEKRPRWARTTQILSSMVGAQYLQNYNIMQSKRRTNYQRFRSQEKKTKKLYYT